MKMRPCAHFGASLVSFTTSQSPPSLTTESNRQNFTMAENGINSDTAENSNATIMNSTMSYNNASATIMPWTNHNGNKTEGTSYETTPAPMTVSYSYSTKMTKKQDKSTTTAKPYTNKGYDTTGIIILILIIVVAIGFGIACYISRRRAKRYAVDFSSRADETNLPLSPVEPMLANDSVPQNGLQTFESGEKRSKEDEKEEEAPTNEEDEPKAESAAEAESPSPPADDSQNKDKDGEPVKPDEPDQQISDGTAEESPKNENNSNNSDVTREKDFKSSNTFWEIPLDSQV
ncbi:uncharacterized protein LOC144021300 isoform X2 [Festucalex cinctus]